MTQIAASPHGEAPGCAYPVDEDTACMSPLSLANAGFLGFYIKSGALFIALRQSTPQWAAFSQVEDVPEGVWVRFTDAEGHVLIPLELRRDAALFEGRWLDGRARPMEKGILDTLRGSTGGIVLDNEGRKHQDFMDSWKRFGGWTKIDDTWIPPRK